MSLNEKKELILVPKESLLFDALSLYVAIGWLSHYWGVSTDECYSRLATEALSQSKTLSPQGEAEIIEAWTKTVMERKRDLN